MKILCDNCKQIFDESQLVEKNDYFLHDEIDDLRYEKILYYQCPYCGSIDVNEYREEYYVE